MPQIRSYPEVTSLLATDAIPLDRIGAGTEFIEAVNLFPQLYTAVLEGFYEGAAPPVGSSLLGGWCLPFKTIFPADNTSALALGWGLHVQAGFLPTASYVIQLALNDVASGTITINTDGTWTYASAGNAQWTGQIRDRVTAIGPTLADATLNRFFWTMVGTQTL